MTGNFGSQLKCLICATQLSNFGKCEDKLLGRHLKIVFLLRNVLNISSDKLVKFLQGCPNVEKWISVCDNCETLVNQCKKLYDNYVKRRENIFKIIKISSSYNCDDSGGGGGGGEDYEGILDIFKEVRKDVNGHYQIQEEHGFGDSKADGLVMQLNIQSQLYNKTVIKQECEDVTTEDDPKSETFFDNCTSDDNDNNEDNPPEVETIPKTEQKSSAKDDKNFKDNLKPKLIHIKLNPPFECPFCQTYPLITFKSPPTQVIKHLQSCKLNTKLKTSRELTCPNCNQFKYSSSNIISFYHHSLICLSSQSASLNFRVFQCDICPTSVKTSDFFSLSKFINHLIHHKEFIYKCTQCSVPFKNSLESDRHWKKHHPREYSAITEDQRSSSSSSCHVTTQPALPSFPWWCPHCSQQFSTEDLRDLHVSSSHHHHHPPISKDIPTCQLCDKRYSCPMELKLHQLMCHPLKQIISHLSSSDTRTKFHECTLCPDIFSGVKGKDDLLTHQSRVHKNFEFRCPTCSKEFNSKGSLRMHCTSHKLDLRCVPCGKTFYYKESLRKHVEVVHEKSKSFICDICGLNLCGKSGLKSHQRDKHGLSEKKWKCEVEGCGIRLKNLTYLKVHMAKHANCPEFKCSACGKEFYEKRNLLRHEKKIHLSNSDEDFFCDECPFRTKFKGNLKTHKNSAHDPK